MAQVRRPSRKRDDDDRNHFISRGSEDNQPNYGRKHGGQKITSERSSLQPISLMVLLHNFDGLISSHSIYAHPDNVEMHHMYCNH